MPAARLPGVRFPAAVMFLILIMRMMMILILIPTCAHAKRRCLPWLGCGEVAVPGPCRVAVLELPGRR